MRLVFKSRKGFVTVEFLVAGILLFFLIFIGTDYWFIQAKQQMCEHLKNYYLDRVRVEGFLSVADEAEMRARFERIGCPVVRVDAPLESQGHERILRNAEDPVSSEVWLEVEARPDPQPFLLGVLIGSELEGEFTLKVGGRVLSERVNP